MVANLFMYREIGISHNSHSLHLSNLKLMIDTLNIVSSLADVVATFNVQFNALMPSIVCFILCNKHQRSIIDYHPKRLREISIINSLEASKR